ASAPERNDREHMRRNLHQRTLMNYVAFGSLALSALIPWLVLRRRVRLAPAWAFGGVLVYLAMGFGMRFILEEAGGRPLYGLSALSQAIHQGEISVDEYQRERARTLHAFVASMAAALAASTAYGVIIRLSSKPKSA